ncbi:MAG TPA: tyrosine--tRNA ligase [Cyclobacteriaceae bacterium]|nr:tyrosine--tRNA ligase [Cyclobacteriaceae bacterium]
MSKKNFVEELRWRGMLHDMMPGTEEQLLKESTTGYIGFDPTADSLHIGSLAQIMTLVHFQRCGHKPIALVGGATGMIGDPSGKKEERKLLSLEDIQHNAACIKDQLSKFLDFSKGDNPALLVNNNDWFSGLQLISFLREAGKYLTVNYLLSKGFVKERLAQEGELSFTEFNYILMQAYDFMHLYQYNNCKLQMGGSDQWGNITAGNDLIRKKLRGEAFALTCKLITKSDGSKFGKTESGNIWLDPKKTSPYSFYQFWLNTSDADASNYIKIFTLLSQEEINGLIAEHNTAPHLRKLQFELAKNITIRVHSQQDYESALKASSILFGNSTADDLKSLDENTLLSVMEGVPQTTITKSLLQDCASVVDLLSEATGNLIFSSKGEARKMIQGGGVSINKTKVDDGAKKPEYALLQGKYLLAQKGKKNYYLIVVQ